MGPALKILSIFRLFGSIGIEVKIILATFAVIIFLPILAVVALAHSALQPVSDVLSWFNPTSKKVEYRDLNGILHQIELSTAWPLKGVVTQEFGHPNFPYEAAHTGIDIGAPIGTPVSVFLPGTVTKVGPGLGCGLCVTVAHEHGLSSSYSHLSEITAQKGQQVKPGDVIGKVGQTGWATGPHLHFMIMLSGINLNPRTFMTGDPPR